MRSNAPEFLANVCKAVVDEHPGYFAMIRLCHDFLMPGWLKEIFTDTQLYEWFRRAR